jgi:hypothetical protein
MAAHDIVMAAAGASSGPAVYIEDVFSVWNYSGNGGTQPVNNGIDVAGKGGLNILKSRTTADPWMWFDSARPAKYLQSNNANPQYDFSGFTQTSTGFSINASGTFTNGSGIDYTSISIRKQPKLLDVVMHSSGSSLTVSHSLGSVPGCIIAKATASTSDWLVVHRGTNGYMFLNSPAAAAGTSMAGIGSSTATAWIAATDTTMDFSNWFAAGTEFVVYALAHNAGGFGLTGTDNVISCGSYVTTGNDNINLGYEPQLIIEHRVNGSSDWHMWDTMRGMSQTSLYELEANTSAAEYSFGGGYVKPTATGYNNTYWSAGQTVIYIAIRRGPMKVPTDGTKVFMPVAYPGDSTANRLLTAGFPLDILFSKIRLNSGGSGGNTWVVDRLRGSPVLTANATFDESITAGYDLGSFNKSQVGYTTGTSTSLINSSGDNLIAWMLRRAPGFFDEVCFTPTGVAHMEPHNLTVVPELIIGRQRDNPVNWYVYAAPLGNTQALYFNTTDAPVSGSYLWNNTSHTASAFSLGNSGLNSSAATKAVAYLAASCPGVSKIGQYSGTAAAQTINCGFAAGARFVLIRRIDSIGDWYLWDSARGIVSGNDPYLLLNSAAAEVTTTDYISPQSSGFGLTASAPAALNASGGTYLFWAIA